MLGIGKLAAGQEHYYVELVRGSDEYYTGPGEDPGRWLGRGAELLGLEGTVTPTALSQILVGDDPISGTRLVANPVKVPGFDLTFKSPKSVSLLFALGDGRVSGEVRAGHEAAVAAAVGWLEAEATLARRGHAGEEVVTGDGLVAAAFTHRTSRAGDPHLHTHVLVANATAGPDGRWTALDARGLYRAAKTAGTLYETQLRAELSARLGVAWGPVRNGIADVAGVDRTVIEAFSTRRHEIEAHLESVGAHSARAADVAALATRQAKDRDVGFEELVPECRATANRHGLDAGTLARLVGDRMPAPWLSPAWTAATFEALAGPHGLTAYRSTFGRLELLQGVANNAPAGLSVSDVVVAADLFLADELIVALDSAGGVRRWTTAELLGVERRLLDGAWRRRDAGVAVVGERSLSLALAAHPMLGADQQAMVERLVGGGRGVEVVIGPAGTGKTTALAAARSAWADAGIPVIGAALAARAATELQAGAGIRSMTVERLLAELDDPRTGGLTPGSVVVVDEAAMVGTRHLARLAAHASAADGKLVLVGDDRQLPSISAGGAFRGLADRLGAVELDVNRRQQAGWERDALTQLRAGEIHRALAAYTARQRMREGRTAVDTRRILIDDWFTARQAGHQTLLLATRRVDVEHLNRDAQARMRDAGLLGDTELCVGDRVFSVGDTVMALRNDHRLGLLNGARGIVTHVDGDELRFRDMGGVERAVPRRYLEDGQLDLGYAMTVHKSQGTTTDRTFLLADDTLFREAGYVAMSRGRNANTVYVPALDRDQEVHGRAQAGGPDLTQVLQKSRAQQLATHDQPPGTMTIRELTALRRTLDADLGPKPRSEGTVERLRVAEQQWSVELDAATRIRREAEARLAAIEQQRCRAREWGRPAAEQQVRVAVERERKARDALDVLAQQGRTLDVEQQRLRAWVAADRERRSQLADVDRQIAARIHTLGAIGLADPPSHLVAILGHPPRDPSRRVTWADAAGQIQAHREQYGITDNRRALGPDRHRDRQQDLDAQRLKPRIEQAQQELGRSPRSLQLDRGVGLER